MILLFVFEILMEKKVKKIVENLSEKKNLQLNLNEPVNKLEFLSNINKIELTIKITFILNFKTTTLCNYKIL